MNTSTSSRGFTLVETLCALAVTAILSSIALPSFSSSVVKARRSDAHVALMQLQVAQERHRANNPSYGGLADIGIGAASPSQHYRLSIAGSSADGFEARADATGLQSVDTACRYLKVTVLGANTVYASGPSGNTDNTAAVNRQCWGAR